MIQINKSITSKVLTIGLQYKNHRGGIGGVIDTYSKYFESFNFICTYGITSSKIKILFNYIKSLFNTFFFLLLNREVKIVHIHGAAKGSVFRKYIVFNISKRIFRKKVIFHSHASEMENFYHKGNYLVKKVCTDFFNSVDLIICLSLSWDKFYNSNFNPKSTIVLENIVDQQTDIEAKQYNNSCPISFLFLGAIGDRKGIFDLLEVISLNKDYYKGKIKLIVGGNGEVDKLRKTILDNSLEEIVIFKGWVSGEEKRNLLETTDVYILPSYNEGLPLSILEAMSYGMPIISTNVGGISEIIHNNINGCLIEPGDFNGIQTSLNSFVESPILLRSYGLKSLDLVKPYYSESVIPKLNKIYLKLLE
ncbi:polysaccharide biosynthesis protein [Neptunitalea chrysea]|uniref:Polysaccharide biosynthesis protein n=1 Tax=Neptunitalea chrysea TaxID=1647581 RepID=A0A9W6B313_9FLAO|nr:glycosyltransferase family 4 protein [Neptunitalea chrysea]GLB51558.1 polysaccharide biosynthesis protein [Neptunitalea chrysea]